MDLFSIFTSTAWIGIFKIHFEFQLSLKIFNKSMAKRYLFFYLSIKLERKLEMRCKNEKRSVRIGIFSVLRF